MRNKKLKIATFCASEFAIPPSKRMKDIYAPLWLTHYITEGLIKKGHQVTLFAGNDSKTNAKLESNNLPSLANNKNFKQFYKQVSEMDKKEISQKLLDRKDVIYNYDFLFLAKLYQEALKGKFDIIHGSLMGLRALPFASLCAIPTILTFHRPLNQLTKKILEEYHKRYSQIHFIALTKSHASSAPNLFKYIVNNGIDINKFKFKKKPKDHLLITGRIEPDKGIYEAIKVAKMTNHKLVIVGRKTEDTYWRKKIKPNIGKDIKFIDFTPYDKMPKYYQNAKAFIFPLKWEEPFGLTMIEAMACGTPVIAFKRGSVPEIVKNNKTGFIVKNVNEMVKAIKKIDEINRIDCRRHIEKNFSVEKMVDQYEKIYLKIIKKCSS